MQCAFQTTTHILFVLSTSDVDGIETPCGFGDTDNDFSTSSLDGKFAIVACFHTFRPQVES